MAANFSSGYLPQWTSLPLLVLFLVLDKLLEPIDHVRFAAVCKEWRFVAKHYNHATRRWHKVFPMLLIPSECQGKTSLTDPKLLYSISEGKIRNDIQLQVPYSKRCIGSSLGWLVTVDLTGQGLIISLRNPFRKAGPIHLPPLDVEIFEHHKSYYEYYFQKVILSADPILNPNSYMVVALYDMDNYRFAFIKGGQTNWTLFDDDEHCFNDVIFYKSQVYAAARSEGVVSLDFNSSDNPSQPPKRKLLKAHDSDSYCGSRMSYLVESTKGDLLQINRILIPAVIGLKMRTVNFKVYKLVFSNEDESTVHNVEVKNIGDEAVFVGTNHSLSVLASNFPRCQPNSIYFTDDWITPGLHELPDRPWDDMGIFNLEDGTITPHYSLNPNWQGYIPPAVWVVPQFNGLC